jgi:hypothetical protein
MRLAVICLCAVFSVQAFGQETTQFKKPTVKIAKEVTKKPVTRVEATKTLNKVWASVAKGLKISGSYKNALPADATAITKDEVLARFESLVTEMTDHFKRSPRLVALRPERYRKDMDKRFYPLVAKGFVSPFSPLTTGKNGTLTPKEFGDAVGILMVRLVDLCHQPSSKYSPNLMGGG